jgi:hypothetical protein
MKFTKAKQKKTAIIAITVFALFAVLIMVSSPLAKYLVQKYDVRYLGREVTVDWVYVNLFTGFVHLKNPEVKELKNDTIFFSANSISADFSMHQLIFSTYEITELVVDKPLGFIIQKNKNLNFSDLIERFKPQGSQGQPIRFSINKITITEGEFHYREKIIPIDYFIKNVNLESSGIRWNADTLASSFSFNAGKGTGIVKGNFTINTRTQDYRLATVVKDLDLELIRQYLWELINYGMFRAQLHANLVASGNFHDVNHISIKGKLAINDFHLGKTTAEDYIACSRLSLTVDDLSPHNNKYEFDSITLDDPFVSYERFDSLDNVQALFGKAGANITDITGQAGRFNLLITIGRYLKTLGQRFFDSKYQINSLAINNGNFKFTDFSLSEKFLLHADSLYFHGDSITKTNKRVKFYLRSGIHPFGDLSASLSINPLDSGDLDLSYQVHNFPVTAFNPYVITYTSFPLDKGALTLNGKWKVREGIIESQNNITLVDPRVGARLKGDETKWIPLPLIMSLVRERGNVINYQIPISGNLKDPKFHLRDVVTDLLTNVFIKPPTISHGLEVKSVEKQIEELLTVAWRVHQFTLEPEQRRFLGKMARFLEKNPNASIEIYPRQYTSKEKEHILYFEARKKYYLLKNNKSENEFNERDSINIERMSVKELGPFFTKDLTKITRDTTLLTIVDKCHHFLGSNIVEIKYDQLIKIREDELRSIFSDTLISARVKFHRNKSTIPYDGFSCHEIKYNGEIPASLQQSYDKMQSLNNKTFRKKYFTP